MPRLLPVEDGVEGGCRSGEDGSGSDEGVGVRSTTPGCCCDWGLVDCCVGVDVLDSEDLRSDDKVGIRLDELPCLDFDLCVGVVVLDWCCVGAANCVGVSPRTTSCSYDVGGLCGGDSVYPLVAVVVAAVETVRSPTPGIKS